MASSQVYTDHARQVKHDPESPGGAVRGSFLSGKSKRFKCLAYTGAFIVVQTLIIVIFVQTIMKLRTPKFRVRSVTLDSTSQFGTPQSPSFNLKMNAELGVKNANFGTYKFQNTSIVFYYGDAQVGTAAVSNSKAGWRSTKKLHVPVVLSSSGLPNAGASQLGREITSGVLTLTGKSKLEGKVALIFIFKKKKATEMDCILTIRVADKAVQDITCK